MPSPLWSADARCDVRNARRNGRLSFAVAYKQVTTPRAAPKGKRRASLQEKGGSAEALAGIARLTAAGAGTADDMVQIEELSRLSIAQNVERRFAQEAIFTSIGPILVVVNPYRWLDGYYSKALMAFYATMSASGDALPPHIFSIAYGAYKGMVAGGRCQALIISGESGAGKTESSKQCMQLIVELTARSAGAAGGPAERGAQLERAAELERRVLAAQPILESFGNACTARNANSSRFGKWLELHFDAHCTIVGCTTVNYLLEKSRVVGQAPRERSFHALYQLCAAAPPDDLCADLGLAAAGDGSDSSGGGGGGGGAALLRARLGLRPAKAFRFLSSGGAAETIEGVNDAEDFDFLCATMAAMGFSGAEVLDVLSALAAALHLGNIEFEAGAGAAVAAADGGKPGGGGCHVKKDAAAQRSLVVAESLLLGAAAISSAGGGGGGGGGAAAAPPRSRRASAVLPGVSGLRLAHALCHRTMVVHREAMHLELRPEQARDAVRALAKAIYARTFDALVGRINELTVGESEDPGRDYSRGREHSIGALDVYGFEIFDCNSLEQLCINYCNEKLQQHFSSSTVSCAAAAAWLAVCRRAPSC